MASNLTQVSNDLSASERKIIAEFCQLLEKSRQSFNSLRELPQFGNKHWQTHFGRTFDVYTKLWKFQQQHRTVLDTKYNLKRWQIGEIASKIGQLYYHYYLRTSEANYLYESFSFYSAIRSRAYYSQASKEESPDLMVKKLRYYARFIVVSLLLNKMELVRELIRELAHYVEEYANVYETEDEDEWQLVMSEVTAFVEADALVNVMTPDVIPVILSHRLRINGVPCMRNSTSTSGLSLQEIFIVGLCEKQIKFSELTLDMFRMLQALEHEPEENISHTLDTSEGHSDGQLCEQPEKSSNKPRNPHKYLLYKPSFSQLFTFLASGFKELPSNSVMLLYLSGDPVLGSDKSVDDDPYSHGGIATSNKSKQTGEESKRKLTHIKDAHCFYPDDLIPFSRKPLVIIVDSVNSDAFKSFPSLFGQPLLCLMSSTVLPNAFKDQNQYGSLFTLFLYSPLVAFCYVCNVNNLRSDLWEKGQSELHKFMVETLRAFSDWSRNIDHTFFQLMDDDFLRLLVLRYVFAFCTMRLHQAFKSFEYYPKSFPSLPKEVLDHGGVQKHILELASIVDARGLFYEIGDAPPF